MSSSLRNILHHKGGRLRFVWECLPGDLPLQHQELEAEADLADTLRDAGLVLTSRCSRSVKHGRRAVLVLEATVRRATPGEAASLAASGSHEVVVA